MDLRSVTTTRTDLATFGILGRIGTARARVSVQDVFIPLRIGRSSQPTWRNAQVPGLSDYRFVPKPILPQAMGEGLPSYRALLPLLTFRRFHAS